MASPFPGMDMNSLQALMQQFQPSEEDKRQARGFAALQAAAGLLGTRKGFEGQGIGQALSGGLLGYQTDIRNQQALRGQNLSQAMQMRQVMQQMQMGDQMAKLLGQSPTVPAEGPPQGFQSPGGAAGLMSGAADTGQMPQPSSMLPTITQQPNLSLRDQLARVNMMGAAVGMPDHSAAINTMFPKAMAARAGAPIVNDVTGEVLNPNPAAPPGYFWDQRAGQFKKVANASEAEAQSKATGKAVDLAFTTPEPVVGKNGRMELPQGSRLDQLFRGQPLPFGAPNPYPQQSAPAPSADATPPAPADAMVVKQSPTQQAEQSERGKNYGEQSSAIDAAAASAQSANARNKEMRALFDQFDTGALTPARRSVASYAQAAGAPADWVDKLAGGNLNAMQAAQKQVVNAAFETTKALTARPAQAEVIMSATKGTPNELMTKPAITAILDYNDGVNRWLQEKQNAKDGWLKNKGTLEGFEGDWNRTHPLDGYIPSVDDLKSVLGGSAKTEAPKIAPAAQQNKTAQMMVQKVLQRGDPTEIQELRKLGYIQ
jgi:hypothetical protein